MRGFKQNLLIGGLTVCISLSSVFFPTMAAAASVAQAVSNTTSIYGNDQYETSAKIAQSGWTGTSDYAILAAGMSANLIDALAAGPLAATLNAPIILTEGNSLNKNAKDQLTRLKVKTVYVTSGAAVIKQSVIDEVKTIASITEVKALGGNDASETSVNIAKEMANQGVEIGKVVVTGGAGSDALSIASIAGAQGMPILYTRGSSLSNYVNTYLAGIKENLTKTYVIGGSAVVSEAVKAQIPGQVQCYFGQSQYDTNIEVLKQFAGVLKNKNTYVANGETLVDALAGVPLAVKNNSLILLTNKTLPAASKKYAQSNLSSNVTGLGGESVVPTSILTELSPTEIISQDGSSIGSGDATNLAQINGTLKVTGNNVTVKNAKTDYSIYIQGDNVCLNNVTVQGTIFLDPGNSGSATLQNVKATNVVVFSGADHSIKLMDVIAQLLNVQSSSPNVHVDAMGSTAFTQTQTSSTATLQAGEGTRFGAISINYSAQSSGAAPVVELRGSFPDTIEAGGGVTVIAASGSNVSKLSVATDNSNQTVTLQGNFNSVEVNSQANVTIGNNSIITSLVTNALANIIVPPSSSITHFDPKSTGTTPTGGGRVGNAVSTTITTGGSSGGGNNNSTTNPSWSSGDTYTGNVSATSDSTYGPSSGLFSVVGNMTLGGGSNTSMTLQNVKVSGTLTLNPGPTGTVTLNNVTASNVVVKSGADHSINLIGVTITGELTVNAPDQTPVRIVTQGSTAIASTMVQSGVSLVNDSTGSNSSNAFGSITLNVSTSGATVQLGGAISSPITVGSSGSDFSVEATTGAAITGTITVNAAVTIQTDGTATIGNVQIAAPVSVSMLGTGMISTVSTTSAADSATITIAAGPTVLTVSLSANVTINAASGATIGNVQVAVAGIQPTLAGSGTFTQVTVASEAIGATVTVASGAQVTTVTVSANFTLTGSGTVGTVATAYGVTGIAVNIQTAVQNLDSTGMDVTSTTGSALALSMAQAETNAQTAASTLVIDYSEGDSVSAVTQNVLLPSTAGGYPVVWTSSNPAVISNQGDVNQPQFGQPDVQVTLMATFAATGTVVSTTSTIAKIVTFELTVKALTFSGGGGSGNPSIPVVTSIMIGGGVSSISIPASGATTSAAFTATVKDQSGITMAGESVIWSLGLPKDGVSVEPSTGVITVQSETMPGSITLVATSTLGVTTSTAITLNPTMEVRVLDFNVADKEIRAVNIQTGNIIILKVREANFDYQAAIGELMQVWYNTDHELVKSQISSISAKYDAIEVAGVDQVKLISEDKKYNISDDNYANAAHPKFTFYVDGEKITTGSAIDTSSVPVGTKYNFAKVCFDKYGDVEFVDAYNLAQFLVVDRVIDGEVVGVEGFGTGGSFDAEDATIIKDGKVITLAELKKGEVLFFSNNANDNDGFAEVYNKTVTGSISEVYNDSITVNDNTYNFKYDVSDAMDYAVDYANAVYINEDGETDYVDSDAGEELQAAGDVTLNFDRAGHLVYIAGHIANDAINTQTAILTEDLLTYASYGKDKVQVSVVLENGDEEVYDLTLEDLDTITIDGLHYDIDGIDPGEFYPTITSTGATPNLLYFLTLTNGFGMTTTVPLTSLATEGMLMKFHLHENGTMKELEFFTTSGSFRTAVTTLRSGDSYLDGKKLLPNTLVFDANKDYDGNTLDDIKAGDVAVTKWSDYEGADISHADYIFNDDNEVIALVIRTTTTTITKDTSYEEAVITRVLRNTDGDLLIITAYVNGAKQTYTVDEVPNVSLAKGDIAVLELDDNSTDLVIDILTSGTEYTDRVSINATTGSAISYVNVGTREVIVLGVVYTLVADGAVLDGTDNSDITVEGLADLRGETNVTIVLDEPGSSFVKYFVIK